MRPQRRNRYYHTASALISRVDRNLLVRFYAGDGSSVCVGEFLNVLIRLRLWKVKEFDNAIKNNWITFGLP